MIPAAPDAGRLTVRQWRGHYLVPADEPAPRRLCDKLDAVVRADLPRCLAACLASALDQADPSLWFIRRLEFDLSVDARWDDGVIAGRVAAATTLAIAREMGAGEGENVIHFPDPAAYLARFAVDAAAGSAWGRWFYRPFEGLRPLPASAAIRTALVDDPALGLAALQRLALGELAAVVRTLSRADAARLLESLADVSDAAPALPATWAAWPSVAGDCATLELPQATLLLFVRTTVGGTAAGPARAAATALATLAELLRVGPPDLALRLRLALSAGDLGALRQCAGAAAPALAPLLYTAADLLDTLAGTPGAGGDAAPRHTRFGGALLLLPLLDLLDLDRLTNDWPALAGSAAAQILRWLILVKCQGRDRAAAAFADPLLRDLLRLTPDCGWSQTAAWLTDLGPARLQALAEYLAAPPPDRPAGAPDEVVWLPAGDLWVARDAQGQWRALRPRDGAPALPTPAPDAPDAADPGPDLDYLSLPPATGCPDDWGLVLTLAAQQVMRCFARRLPGFAASGCAYLRHNFLDCAASLEPGPERLVARLGRPPLQLILGLTGATRATLRLAWLDPRPLALFSED